MVYKYLLQYFLILIAIELFTSSALASENRLLPEDTVDFVKANSWQINTTTEKGTAFPIYDNFFLTAWHTVRDKHVSDTITENSKVSLKNLVHPDMKFRFDKLEATLVYKGCLEYKGPRCTSGGDVAMVKVSDGIAEGYPWLDISFKIDPLISFWAVISGYPSDSRTPIVGSAYFSVENLHDNYKRDFPNPILAYFADTGGQVGQSGSAVVTAQQFVKGLLFQTNSQYGRGTNVHAVDSVAIMKAVDSIPSTDSIVAEYESWINGALVHDMKKRLKKMSNTELFLLAKHSINMLRSDTLVPRNEYLIFLYGLLIERRIDFILLRYEDELKNIPRNNDLRRDSGKVASSWGDYHFLLGDEVVANRYYERAESVMLAFVEERSSVVFANKNTLNDVVDQMVHIYTRLNDNKKSKAWISVGAAYDLPNQIERLARTAFENKNYEDAVFYYQAAQNQIVANNNQSPQHIIEGLNLSLTELGNQYTADHFETLHRNGLASKIVADNINDIQLLEQMNKLNALNNDGRVSFH
tara:strand:+ start:6124 stop:7701 length:1578 start_codon:yes stop_codon:yes gene_type:complete